MRNTPEDHVDTAVLFHISKSGGLNTGSELTIKRLDRLLADGSLSGRSLYRLMVSAAAESAAEANDRAFQTRGSIAAQLRRLNETIDSARLEHFITRIKEEGKA